MPKNSSENFTADIGRSVQRPNINRHKLSRKLSFILFTGGENNFSLALRSSYVHENSINNLVPIFQANIVKNGLQEF